MLSNELYGVKKDRDALRWNIKPISTRKNCRKKNNHVAVALCLDMFLFFRPLFKVICFSFFEEFLMFCCDKCNIYLIMRFCFHLSTTKNIKIQQCGKVTWRVPM